MTLTKGQRLGILEGTDKLVGGMEHIFEVIDNPSSIVFYGVTDASSYNSNRLNPEYKIVLLKVVE